VTDVQRDVEWFSHTFPDDVDIFVGGPAGQNLILLSDVGAAMLSSA